MSERPQTDRPARTRRTALRTAVTTVAATAVLTGGLLSPGLSPSAAAADWAATATKALPLAGAVSLGTAPANTPLRLTIGLAPRDRAGIDTLIRAQNTPGSAQYGIFWTRSSSPTGSPPPRRPPTQWLLICVAPGCRR